MNENQDEIVYSYIDTEGKEVMNVVQADGDSSVGYWFENDVIAIWKSSKTGNETNIIPISRLINLRKVLR